MPNSLNVAVGFVKSVKGQIAQVEIESKNYPQLYEILVSPQDPAVALEVFSQERGVISCQILSSSDRLYRGMELIGTGSELKIPVGKAILGRVMDLFGQPRDNGG